MISKNRFQESILSPKYMRPLKFLRNWSINQPSYVSRRHFLMFLCIVLCNIIIPYKPAKCTLHFAGLCGIMPYKFLFKNCFVSLFFGSFVHKCPNTAIQIRLKYSIFE